jgi:hypothetical protein
MSDLSTCASITACLPRERPALTVHKDADQNLLLIEPATLPPRAVRTFAARPLTPARMSYFVIGLSFKANEGRSARCHDELGEAIVPRHSQGL